MTPTLGGRIWVPCEVKPGPFPDERLVRIAPSGAEEWVGFVPADALQDDIFEGSTCVVGTIIEIHDESISVHFPGHAVSRSTFESPISRIKPFGSVEAGHCSIYQ